MRGARTRRLLGAALAAAHRGGVRRPLNRAASGQAHPLVKSPPPTTTTHTCAGQEGDARALHSNFTAAWSRFGWLPEAFGFDLGGVSGQDPGYNLRPEHIESTYLLHGALRAGAPTRRPWGPAC